MTNEILEQNTVVLNPEEQEWEATIPWTTGNQSEIATVFDWSQGIERQWEGFNDNQDATSAHA